jgi:hypothetical protein
MRTRGVERVEPLMLMVEAREKGCSEAELVATLRKDSAQGRQWVRRHLLALEKSLLAELGPDERWRITSIGRNWLFVKPICLSSPHATFPGFVAWYLAELRQAGTLA